MRKSVYSREKMSSGHRLGLNPSCVKVQVTQSCPTFCDAMDNPQNSPGQNTEVGSLSLLQGIFTTQGLNQGLPHGRKILYQLRHKRSLRILEWVVYPFSSRSSEPRNWTGVSCIAGRFFTTESPGRPPQMVAMRTKWGSVCTGILSVSNNQC